MTASAIKFAAINSLKCLRSYFLVVMCLFCFSFDAAAHSTDNTYTETFFALSAIACITFILLILFIIKLTKKYKIAKAKLNETTLLVEESQSIVEKTKADAKKSEQEKIHFLARVSHEIRTPMNSVQGMTEALSLSELTPQQKVLLSSLDNSTKNLVTLLNNVLDFSKIDAGKLTLEQVPTNVQMLALNIVNNFQQVAQQKSLTINLVFDESITHQHNLDPTRVTQVLNNLIDNAVKFTHEGSVTIVIETVSTNNTNEEAEQARPTASIELEPVVEQIRFSIIDTGIGISEQQQQHLFSPFTQAENDTTRKFGGTGLGLSICQELVQAMGGEITIKSTAGNGSCFSFSLPLTKSRLTTTIAERRKNERKHHAKDDQRFEDIRVLVVEDNLINIAVLTAQLERLNIHPDVANDGVEALEMFKKSEYHIVLSDCHMPNMDGFELAKALSELPKTSPLWLIAITADTLVSVREKCVSAGFNDYLSKPCNQESITDAINNAYRQLQLL